MNLALIDRIIEIYQERLTPEDYNRLVFFRGIWEIQAKIAAKVALTSDYSAPDPTATEELYWQGEPLLLHNPASVEATLYVRALQECAAYLAEKGSFASEINSGLQGFDWQSFVEQADTKTLGSDPSTFVAGCFDALVEQQVSEELISIIGIVLVLGLRPMLEPISEQIMGSLNLDEASAVHQKPVHCPICGATASAANVGTTPSGAANGKVLYCATCSTTWEFERIRCAHCGTKNQGKLHYFHEESDSAHRLYLCDDCGEYTRTVFQDELNAPFSFEVEDMVMAKLDAIAHSRKNENL